MKTWIVLLRGINVGGKNKLSMADLRQSLTAAGFDSVQTYIQSGNVVLQAEMPSEDVKSRTEVVLATQYDINARVMVLSPDDIRRAMAANPLVGDKPNWMFHYFLEGIPPMPDVAALEALRSENERIALVDDVFYFYAGDGAGRSKLAAKIERHLGVAATARNLNTVKRLMAMTGEVNG